MTQPAFSSQVQGGLDLSETGAPKEGVLQKSEKRLFMQLQVFTGCSSPKDLVRPLEDSALEAVLYLDVNDPRGVGIQFLSENPQVFTESVRTILTREPFISLAPRPDLTMFGRTYSSGREADLEDWLLYKPRRAVLNPKWPWAIWYPLRRKPEFELLTKEEQGKILSEHAKLGMEYGRSDLAHDIRLACYGLDQKDNEFVLGLVGADLYPLSRLVQDMRKTQQTAKYIQSLGPFFVGRVIWQSPLK